MTLMQEILNQLINNPGFNFALIIAQIISSLVIAIALYFTIKNYLRTQINEQVKIAHGFFERYEDLLKELAVLKELGKVKDERMDWATRYCRSIEWFSFLVNTKQITDERIIGFYEEIITNTHENVVPGYFGSTAVGKLFPEIHELYEDLKKGKVSVRRRTR
jgi:hypothetical protein